MFVSFTVTHLQSEDILCILERDNPFPDTAIDDDLIADAKDLRLHNHRHLILLLRELAKGSSVTPIVICRNKRAVIDKSCLSRVCTAISDTARNGNWAMISAGGLGVSGQRYVSTYSSEQPFLAVSPTPKLIIDSMLDLYVVNALLLREFLELENDVDDLAFELMYICFGYAHASSVSIYHPMLSCGIDGPYLSRDFDAMPSSIARVKLINSFGDNCLETLAGPVKLHKASSSKAVGETLNYTYILEQIQDAQAVRFGISIITRTQFKRLHLLRRLLASIMRARDTSVDVEVVLATDAPEEEAAERLALLQREFPRLVLRVAWGDRESPSRVGNLIAGLQAAQNELSWVIDDDDYVDIGCFRHVSRHAGRYPNAIFFVTTEVVQETWENSRSDAPAIKERWSKRVYRARAWIDSFGGVNQVPICGYIAPTNILAREARLLARSYDLSEDYTLLLRVLASPDLPEIIEIDEKLVFISERPGGDNSITAVDRRPWTRDISGFLTQLFYGDGASSPGRWQVLTRARQKSAGELNAVPTPAEVVLLRHQIAYQTRETRRLQKIVADATADCWGVTK